MISSMNSIMDQIRKHIFQFNNEEDKLTCVKEEDVFKLVLNDGLDDDLAKNVSFWKNMEQIHMYLNENNNAFQRRALQLSQLDILWTEIVNLLEWTMEENENSSFYLRKLPLLLMAVFDES